MKQPGISPKPTLIDHAILGLISARGMSGYGIRKVFETTAMGNYGSSPGTIYPALKRLQRLGLAEKRKSKEDGKNKFYITPHGKKIFKSWLTRPLGLNDVARKLDEILLRFAFMDILPGKKPKVLFLQSLSNLLSIYIEQLKEFRKKEYDNLPLLGRLSFEHGIESYKTTLKWCKNTLPLFTKIN